MTHHDPVCGMDVEANTPHQSTHEGQRYYFCSAGCKAAFELKPEQFTDKKGSGEVH